MSKYFVEVVIGKKNWLRLFSLFLLHSVSCVGLFVSMYQPVFAETGNTGAELHDTVPGNNSGASEKIANEAGSRHQYYYFRPEKTGAGAFYNPISMIVEGGLGGLYNKKLTGVEWEAGARELWRQLSNPVGAISQYGTKAFFYNEFIPHIGKGRNFAPNYWWHLIGGGFRTKLIEEYYHYNQYSRPRTMAWLTIYSMHFLNELVQAEHFYQIAQEGDLKLDENRSIDALPDLLFFDWLGGVLFNLDPINRLASGTFHLREWTYQSQLNPVTGRLLNNGQLYWARLHISGPFGLSVLTGEQISTFNISIDVAHDYQLSFGTGVKAKTFHFDSTGNIDAEALSLNFGIYWSKDDNPLVIATYEMANKEAIAQNPRVVNEYTEKTIINIYPGLFEFYGFRPGITLSYQKEAYFAGISIIGWPAGVIFSTPQKEKYLNAF